MPFFGVKFLFYVQEAYITHFFISLLISKFFCTKACLCSLQKPVWIRGRIKTRQGTDEQGQYGTAAV
jgi:hypothetical protein